MAELKVKIIGLNYNKILNVLIEKGVLIKSLKIKSKNIIFIINENDKSVLDKVCKFYKKEYQIIEKKSFKNIFKYLPFKLGCMFAILISCLYIYSYSTFIFNIKIFNKTNQNFDNLYITEVLKNNGVIVGGKRNIYSVNDIENLIIKNVSGLSGCSVRFDGGNLLIDIIPEIKKQEVSSENIYSLYDAKILSAEAYSGELKVKAGDMVKKGDMLIQNNMGASGKITAQVYFVSTKIHQEKQEKMKLTGNVQKFKIMKLFNKILNKSQNYCTFSNYLIKKCDFYLNENYFLPIKCEEFLCYEYEVENIEVSFDSVEDNLKEQLYFECVNKLPENIEPTLCNYSIVREGSFVRVDCYLEAVINLI